MTTSRLRLCPVVLAAAIGAGGCGGSLAQGGLGATQQARVAPGTSGDLLYVAHAHGEGTRAIGFVTIYAFPQGQKIATISGIGFPTGVCADSSGNVWVLAVLRNVWNAYEYPHGGTTPIARIRIRNPNVAAGCAVDPTTGDLAIFTGVKGQGVRRPLVEIWRGARNGKPARYPLTFTPVAGAYDPSGNLFVDGYLGGNQQFDFVELAKGSNSFAMVKIDKPTEFPGGVEWDGGYITVETGGLGRRRPVVFRLTVSGSHATVVGITHPAHIQFESPFSVADGFLVAVSGGVGRRVSLWSYPGGGEPTEIAHFAFTPRGLVVSRANP